MDGSLRTEIARKAFQRVRRLVVRVVWVHVAVVVTGDREDGRRVMQVWLVELPVIVGDFPIVIDDVTQVIKEGRIGPIRVVIAEVKLHVSRYVLLIRRRVYAAGVPDGVKHQPLPVDDLLDRLFREN